MAKGGSGQPRDAAFIAAARVLWDKQLTTAEIGARMGVTKNVIIGIAHRYSFTKRPNPISSGYAIPRGSQAEHLIRELLGSSLTQKQIAARVGHAIGRRVSDETVRNVARRLPEFRGRRVWSRPAPKPVGLAVRKPVQLKPIDAPRPVLRRPAVDATGCPGCFWLVDAAPGVHRYCDAPVVHPSKSWCVAHYVLACQGTDPRLPEDVRAAIAAERAGRMRRAA